MDYMFFTLEWWLIALDIFVIKMNEKCSEKLSVLRFSLSVGTYWLTEISAGLFLPTHL